MKKRSGLVCIYQAQGPFEGHQVAHWLERNDIEVRILGDLVGLAGGIPVTDAWPSLWVKSEDTERAKIAIQRFSGPRAVHPEWTCPGCGETNAPTFGSCWSCETLRPTT